MHENSDFFYDWKDVMSCRHVSVYIIIDQAWVERTGK